MSDDQEWIWIRINNKDWWWRMIKEMAKNDKRDFQWTGIKIGDDKNWWWMTIELYQTLVINNDRIIPNIDDE